jgi:hypothetical protein
MAKSTVRQGEALLLPFRIKNKLTGKPLPLTGANFLLWVKRPEDVEPVIVKSNSDFDKAGVASGYVTTFLQAQDTIQEIGIYDAELRVVTADSPPKTMKLPFEFEIEEATTPNDFTVEVIGIVSLEAFGEPFVSQ